MVRSLLACAGAAVLLSSLVLAQPTAARAAAPPQASTPDGQPRPDVLSQLLAEVHELRLVMQRQGADSSRIQLLISRLSMQEGRVTRIARDLDGVRSQLSRMAEEQSLAAERLKDVEGAVSRAAEPERTDMEQQAAVMRRQLAYMRSEEQRLRGQESDLDTSLASEQARWMEINNRLDELERSIGRPE